MSTILVSIVLIAKGAYDYKVVKSSLLVEANRSITLVSERLKLNLPAAIWMDLSDQIVKIASSEELAVVEPAVEGNDKALVADCRVDANDLISP